MQTLKAQDGYWLTDKDEKPIGEWWWSKIIYCPDFVDTDATYKQVTDEEKVAKEAEQEEWRRRQEPEQDGQSQD